MKNRENMERIREFFATQDQFAQYTGIDLLEVEPGRARVAMEIKPFHFNGARTVHGGAIFTLADFAFAVASNSHGNLAMGINTSVSFVKAATCGHLFAEALEVVRNPRLASYTVHVTDDAGDLVAIFQRMAYRKKDELPAACNPDIGIRI